MPVTVRFFLEPLLDLHEHAFLSRAHQTPGGLPLGGPALILRVTDTATLTSSGLDNPHRPIAPAPLRGDLQTDGARSPIVAEHVLDPHAVMPMVLDGVSDGPPVKLADQMYIAFSRGCAIVEIDATATSPTVSFRTLPTMPGARDRDGGRSNWLHTSGPRSFEHMRQPVGPLREWVGPLGLTAVHPCLDGFPLHLVHLALAVLAPGLPGVIDSCDRVSAVWVIGAGHAMRVSAPIDRSAGTAVVPRPLGGSWAADTPAVLLTAEQVATVCQDLQPGLANMLSLYDAVAVMRELGGHVAANLADDWAQHTIGGSTTGDVRETAQRVLDGIADGDPAVLDALPALPMDRGDASHANSNLVTAYEEHAQHLAGPWSELGAFGRDALLDAVTAGFDDAYHDAISAACLAVLDPN
ncbi:hypothetical protein [Longispora urticae]